MIPPGGHLYSKLDIILVKKKFTQLGLFFMTRRCTCVGAKSCKIRKKGCVLSHFYKFGKGYDGKIERKKIMQKHVIRVHFHTSKICA